MKPLKHILVVVALLAAMLPCGHAEHHDHGQDVAMELCALAAEPCECHSCNHQPCPDSVEIQLDHNTPDLNPIEHPPALMLLFVLPETKPVLKESPPLAPGMLAALQTVQLLI